MTDGPTVAELDAPALASSREGRFLPWLWIAVGALLIGGVVSAFVIDGAPSGSERVAAAAAAVEDAGTFAFTLALETTGPVTSSFTIEGGVDASTGRSMSSLQMDGTSVVMVSDGDALYVQVPEESRESSAGKPWVRLDTAALTSGLGGVTPSASPLQTFEQLRDAGEVEELGQEEVRGVATTHFRTVVDMSGSVPEGPGTAEVRQALKAVEVEVWLDDEDRIRRHRTTLELASIPGGGPIVIVTTIETYDFGKPVTIEIPPADQVHEAGPGGLESLFAPGPPVAESSTD